MPHIKCNIEDQEYTMDYMKQSSKDGYIFHGTVLYNPPIKFQFHTDFDLKTFTATFEPNDIPFPHKNAIFDAIKDQDIEGDEKTNSESPNGWLGN